MMKNPITWFVVFTAIMVLAVTYLFSIDETTIGWLGLPSWLYWFLMIELLYCAAMWVFVQRFWDHNENLD